MAINTVRSTSYPLRSAGARTKDVHRQCGAEAIARFGDSTEVKGTADRAVRFSSIYC